MGKARALADIRIDLKHMGLPHVADELGDVEIEYLKSAATAIADAHADGKAEGIRETKESEFRLALQAITAAIREEREACAVLVEEHVVEDCYYDNSDSDARMTLSSAAAAIRARSGK